MARVCGSSVVTRDASKNPKTLPEPLTINPNLTPDPDAAPTHINFVSKKSGVFFNFLRLVDHTIK